MPNVCIPPNTTAPDKRVVFSYLEATQVTKHAVKSVLSSSSEKPTESQLDILLATINKPEILAEALRKDPLAKAKLRGLNIKAKILKDCLSGEFFSQLLGISRQALDKRRNKGQVLAFSLGRRGYAYPTWQIHEGKIPEGLDKVLFALNKYSDWGKAIFLTTGDIRLNDATPMDYLRDGKFQEVITAAEVYGEHSAA